SSVRVRAESTTSPSVSPTPTPTPTPSSNVKNGKWSTFLKGLGQLTLVTVVTATGAIVYFTQKDKNPGTQLPFDESKKTLVVLGSGWGATSFLRTLDTDDYNVIVVSPKNYFLFTPLLPSVAVGTIQPRSIIQRKLSPHPQGLFLPLIPIPFFGRTATRYITRHKKRVVSVVEADAQEVDPVNKTVTVSDTSEIKGQVSTRTIPFDYLV
ncbi:hypothetical protein EW145_g8672, partial [Phellinidium pouzarii]